MINILHYLAIIPGGLFLILLIKEVWEDLIEILFWLIGICFAGGLWYLLYWGIKGIING